MTAVAPIADPSPDEGWGRLRVAVALEGATLVALALIAVPLKRLAGVPVLVQIAGPVHGLAFLFLVYVLVEGLSARMFGARAALRLLVGALVPFGGLVNERWVARRLRPKGAASC